MNFTVLLMSLFISAVAMALPSPLVPDPKNRGNICDESNIDFKEYRYSEQIPYCERNVSSRMKIEIYQDYGIEPECRYQYTIDHFFPLSLGGDNSRENLWPEHKNIKASRINLETNLYKQISQGRITQARALQIIQKEKLAPDTSKIADPDECNPKNQDFWAKVSSAQQ